MVSMSTAVRADRMRRWPRKERETRSRCMQRCRATGEPSLRAAPRGARPMNTRHCTSLEQDDRFGFARGVQQKQTIICRSEKENIPAELDRVQEWLALSQLGGPEASLAPVAFGAEARIRRIVQTVVHHRFGRDRHCITRPIDSGRGDTGDQRQNPETRKKDPSRKRTGWGVSLRNQPSLALPSTISQFARAEPSHQRLPSRSGRPHRLSHSRRAAFLALVCGVRRAREEKKERGGRGGGGESGGERVSTGESLREAGGQGPERT